MHRAEAFRTPLEGFQAVATRTDRSFPRHAHDQFGIGVMIEGAQRSWSGVGPVEQQAGDVIMVNPGEIHDGTAHGAARCWRMLYCDPALVGSALGGTGLADGTLPPRAEDSDLAGRVLLLFASAANGASLLATEVALGEALDAAFDRHALDIAGGRRPRLASVARARQRLDDAPSAPVTVAELAALAGLSRTQLLRGFRHETGTSPHAYQVQRRVQLARRLLQGDMPPAEAAAASGFADQSHMTRAFVRQLGVSPGRYRRAVR